jgi:uncharacterized protein
VFKLQLLPRENRFFDLFEAASANLLKAAYALADLLDHYEDVAAKVEHIRQLEHEGDGIIHDIMNQLRKTFIPPLDREDIVALANRVDDVLDDIEEATALFVLYKIPEPTITARELGQVIVQQAEVINETMPCLRRKEDMQRIPPATVEINRLENVGDDAYRRGLASLFDGSVAVLDVIKWREIYELLEGATDRAEDIADAFEGVVLRNA